jgi:hypothetical protein
MFDDNGQPLLSGDYKLKDHVGWIAVSNWSMGPQRRINQPGSLGGSSSGPDITYQMNVSLADDIPPAIIAYLFNVINSQFIRIAKIAKMECKKDDTFVLKMEFAKANLVAMTMPDTTMPILQVSYANSSVTYRKDDGENTAGLGAPFYNYPLTTKHTAR